MLGKKVPVPSCFSFHAYLHEPGLRGQAPSGRQAQVGPGVGCVCAGASEWHSTISRRQEGGQGLGVGRRPACARSAVRLLLSTVPAHEDWQGEVWVGGSLNARTKNAVQKKPWKPMWILGPCLLLAFAPSLLFLPDSQCVSHTRPGHCDKDGPTAELRYHCRRVGRPPPTRPGMRCLNGYHYPFYPTFLSPSGRHWQKITADRRCWAPPCAARAEVGIARHLPAPQQHAKSHAV